MTEYSIGSRVKHPSRGIGVIIGSEGSSYRVFFDAENILEIGKSFAGLELIEFGPPATEAITIEVVEQALKNVLEKFSDINGKVELGQKWVKGILIFEPNDTSLKAHEIPVETFFHKVVMLRDRLRVMEQQINAHKVLTDEEKVHLQQYITKIYGSLTSFNFLFKNKEDYFVGEKSS